MLTNGELVECTECRNERLFPFEKDAAHLGFSRWQKFMRRMHKFGEETYEKNLRIQKVWFSKDLIESCEIVEPRVPFRSAWLEMGGEVFGYQIADGVVTKWLASGSYGEVVVDGWWDLDEDGSLPAHCQEPSLLKANAISASLWGEFSSKNNFVGTDKKGDFLPAGAEDSRSLRIIRVGEADVAPERMRLAIEAAKKRKHSVRGHYRHLAQGAVYVRPHQRGVESEATKITDLKFE